MSAWWGGLGRGQRIGVAVVGVVVVVNLALSALGSLLATPGGPVSSSFSTGTEGLEAYADLLGEAGHPVTRLRNEVAPADVPPTATVVVADPGELTPSEGQALAEFVLTGGRLVVAGESATPLVQGITGIPVEWQSLDRDDELAVWVPGSDVGDAQTIAGDRGGRWVDPGALLPMVGDDDGAPMLVVGQAGDGEVIAVAETAVLHNRNLARADNAALGLALAGPVDQPVIFVESVHGFGATGMAAVPSSWKWTAAGLALAIVVGLWAAGSRFGPAESEARELRPPRRDHIVALAAAEAAAARTHPTTVAPEQPRAGDQP